MSKDSDPEVIINTYKQMSAECQQTALKINELGGERDQHRLVIENLSKLEPERKAFRLIGSVLVQRTVGEILPIVQINYDGIKELIVKLESNLAAKDKERNDYKIKHGIMTQDEREAKMKSEQRLAAAVKSN